MTDAEEQIEYIQVVVRAPTSLSTGHHLIPGIYAGYRVVSTDLNTRVSTRILIKFLFDDPYESAIDITDLYSKTLRSD